MRTGNCLPLSFLCHNLGTQRGLVETQGLWNRQMWVELSWKTLDSPLYLTELQFPRWETRWSCPSHRVQISQERGCCPSSCQHGLLLTLPQSPPSGTPLKFWTTFPMKLSKQLRYRWILITEKCLKLVEGSGRPKKTAATVLRVPLLVYDSFVCS